MVRLDQMIRTEGYVYLKASKTGPYSKKLSTFLAEQQ